MDRSKSEERKSKDCRKNGWQTESVPEESHAVSNMTSTRKGQVKANVIDRVLVRWDLDQQAKTVKTEKVQHKEKSRKVLVRLENQINLRVPASICRAVLIWYCARRSDGDNVSPNTNLNISQNQVANVTRHETPSTAFRASQKQFG